MAETLVAGITMMAVAAPWAAAAHAYLKDFRGFAAKLDELVRPIRHLYAFDVEPQAAACVQRRDLGETVRQVGRGSRPDALHRRGRGHDRRRRLDSARRILGNGAGS